MTKKTRSVDREEFTVVLKGEQAESLREIAWGDGMRVEDMIEIAVEKYINEEEANA